MGALNWRHINLKIYDNKENLINVFKYSFEKFKK